MSSVSRLGAAVTSIKIVDEWTREEFSDQMSARCSCDRCHNDVNTSVQNSINVLRANLGLEELE